MPEQAKDDGPSITPEQSRLLHKLVNDLGLDRDMKLVGIAAVIGRAVESSKDLSKAEASQVIDRLQKTVEARRASSQTTDDAQEEKP